jgi:poly(3-hydroxybutyrate) depolymerase
VACDYEEQIVPGQADLPRTMVWQVPLGMPPAAGWPVVILFQGSFFAPAKMFIGHASDGFGRYHMARTVKALLDAGYAVLAPAAHGDGSTYWDTNVPPWSFAWESSPDHAFMLSIFDQIAAATFGPLDESRMYAAGISSGGYMTSRMAVSYPGKFKALAVHSASYATCSSAICNVPKPLPSDHPPTLFLHGEADAAAPISAMKLYDARLVAEGKETRVVIDPKAGHEWIAVGAEEVLAWFDKHP